MTLGYYGRWGLRIEQVKIPTSRAKNAREMGHPEIPFGAGGEGRGPGDPSTARRLRFACRPFAQDDSDT
jgi:hypothetical protein